MFQEFPGPGIFKNKTGGVGTVVPRRGVDVDDWRRLQSLGSLWTDTRRALVMSSESPICATFAYFTANLTDSEKFRKLINIFHKATMKTRWSTFWVTTYTKLQVISNKLDLQVQQKKYIIHHIYTTHFTAGVMVCYQITR